MKTLVRHKPCSKLMSNDNVSMLHRDSKKRRDVVEVFIEKLSSTSSLDAERDSLNKVFGRCVTRSNRESVDAWQSKSLQENDNTVFKTVSRNFKIIAPGEFPSGTLTSKLTMWLGVKFLGLIGRCNICDWVKLSQKCMTSNFWSNQHIEKAVFKYETGNV